MNRLGYAAAGVAGALFLSACNLSRTAYQMGFDTELLVTRVESRGGYLDATLRGEAGTVRVFAPATEECRSALAPEERVQFESVGAGRVSRDGAQCDAAGFGPLEELRRRRGHPVGRAIPREQADWRVVHQDDETIFLRGRFPLANLVGWAGGDDTIAVVPSTPACRTLAEREVGSLEYRSHGDTLALVADDGLCPLEALIRPGAR
jgi:hypothetical protein